MCSVQLIFSILRHIHISKASNLVMSSFRRVQKMIIIISKIILVSQSHKQPLNRALASGMLHDATESELCKHRNYFNLNSLICEKYNETEEINKTWTPKTHSSFVLAYLLTSTCPSCACLHIEQCIFSTRLCPSPASPPSLMISPGISRRSKQFTEHAIGLHNRLCVKKLKQAYTFWMK